MTQPTWANPLVFVLKVFGLSLAIAVGLKTIAPQLPIPATNSVSLAIVLTPSVVVGALLGWQLWTSTHADSPHSGRD